MIIDCFLGSRAYKGRMESLFKDRYILRYTANEVVNFAAFDITAWRMKEIITR